MTKTYEAHCYFNSTVRKLRKNENNIFLKDQIKYGTQNFLNINIKQSANLLLLELKTNKTPVKVKDRYNT